MTDTATVANTPSTGPAAPVDSAQPPVTPVVDVQATPAVVPASEPATTEAPSAPIVPEKYDFKAFDGKVDPAVLSKVSAYAKETGLTQDQAAKMVGDLAPAVAEAQKANQAKAIANWEQAAKADKEFGGEKLQENLAVAKKALETFGTPELTKMLNDTGLGNHPEIIRAFFRAGQKISSGTFVPSGQGAFKSTDSNANKLYPSMK
jgi:hypothetical protein